MLKRIIFLSAIALSLNACIGQKQLNEINTKNHNSEAGQVETLKQNANSVQNSPLDQVYRKIQSFEDMRTVDLQQEFDTPESGKSHAKVTVTYGGLADDSVSAQRETYQFEYINSEWKEISKDETWKCGRGPDTTNFHNKLCP